MKLLKKLFVSYSEQVICEVGSNSICATHVKLTINEAYRGLHLTCTGELTKISRANSRFA